MGIPRSSRSIAAILKLGENLKQLPDDGFYHLRDVSSRGCVHTAKRETAAENVRIHLRGV